MDSLAGTEIHGFRTMEDLDVANIMMEAKGRWLRPNEILAILCNSKHFNVQVKPVNLPPSGTIVLFDRKMLRNFRKDGHNWKKKKDGKTVKEAHEHLKVGDEERIHVYYAHGEDNPTFVRRCYWLLDKSLEHIVLVHYRETKESQVAPATPVNSNSSSVRSDPSASWVVSEESDSAADPAYHSSERADLGPNQGMNIKDHELRLYELNTLEWDELVVQDDPYKQIASQHGRVASGQPYQCEQRNYENMPDSLSANKFRAEGYLEKFPRHGFEDISANLIVQPTVSFQAVGDERMSISQPKKTGLMTMFSGDALQTPAKDDLQAQDSFGRWMDKITADSPLLLDDTTLKSSISTFESFASPNMDSHHSSAVGQIFWITDVSPSSAPSNEETKILVVGFFHEGQVNISKSNLFLICGEACIPAEAVQSGVYRCVLSPQEPAVVNLFLSFDGQRPISQVVMFEFRALPITNSLISFEDNSSWEYFEVQLRLAHLLFSTSRGLDILSTKVTPTAMKEVKKFSRKTSHLADGWRIVMTSIKAKEISYPEAKRSLIELTLQNKLREWLLERIGEGRKVAERDEQGQGVIHLCAILGYTWAVYPFSWSDISLDYRDKFGWTALHWAAYYGREAMVAKLLSAGAKANLVTDPTSANPGGCTAADLASKNGYDGLGAYLAEKALVQHFQDMTLAGNVSGSLQTVNSDPADPGNFNEDELYLKDSLAAYRNAADAAARIQAAFREHSLKVQTKAVESTNPEIEARNIVAALKIQHAFRNYNRQKRMAAAARIQHRFRTWKIRRDFLNMRKQAIRIQAVFRGFQVRKQYRKIIWSVGVLEKAILRWRLKRKGFRGLQVHPDEGSLNQKQADDVEEDFFKASRKQAEERVERSVVRVQAMFRSKLAQEAYRRMKLAYSTATLEYEELENPDGMTED